MSSTCREFTFLSADGSHSIHAVAWYGKGEPRAVVQIVHGLSEYVERYAPFAAFLNDHGFVVVGHDHLGHGKTAADRSEYGSFPEKDGWHTVNRDVRALREWAGREWPGLPHFLLGHSMGSFQARTYLIDYPGTVSGCLLSGTGQESEGMVILGKVVSGALCRLRGPRYVSKLVTAFSLGAYNNQFKPTRTSADWLSRDTAVVDEYVGDPQCEFVPTVGMFHAMMEGLQYIGDSRNLAKMDKATPVVLFSGDADPVGGRGKGVEKVYRLFCQAGCADVSMKLYPGARHEILNEINRQEVYGDMLLWLEEHMK